MQWVYLALAILLEIFGTTLMKMSDGLTKMLPTAGMFLAYALCFGSLALALKKIPVSVAYAVWSGVGIVIISVIGILVFKETINTLKVVSIVLIVAGVVGLNLSGTAH
ncbi:cation/cationic drug transporter [Desulfitobacterium dehalogenans ATCC 51507]|uniref:Cation/cationic drug transporter n=1 Tax=Desulfitobacterium dehalogenans (strain ATCC 51507 / DSM 9161 / JW/IU-DC1) TaxID=756499 RepID=I4A7U9_DESDJ|nr:multidrug efflux SMR transporter [Desulfitobacterium dehalogenans]AFM00034.1 cation/cationic drug transporter [Desulfitobacterium dehalogenans ATCC 51507]